LFEYQVDTEDDPWNDWFLPQVPMILTLTSIVAVVIVAIVVVVVVRKKRT
jgi:hypothetical protein